MNIFLAGLLTVLYYIAWPIYWPLYAIVITILFILKAILFLILYLLQPIVVLGAFIVYAAQLPYHFLRRFETLYVFLGVGGLVGLVCGLALHTLMQYLTKTLRLHPQTKVRGPTAKEHRVARQQKKAATVDPIYASPGIMYDESPPRGRKDLLSQVIHEEVDSDF